MIKRRQATALLIPILIFCSPAVIGAGEARRPTWVDKGIHPAYPSELFLTGVGLVQMTGDVEGDWKRAEDNARAKLIEQIRVQVGQTVTSQEVEEITGKKSSTRAVTEIVTKTVATLTLEGVQIPARWEDKEQNLLYALAVLDRDQTSQLLRSKIEDARREADELFNRAQGEESSGEILLALTHYVQAHKKLSTASSNILILRIIRGSLAAALEKEPKPVTTAGLGIKIESIVSYIKLIPLSGNDQKGEPGKSLAEPLVVKAVYDSGTVQHPLKGIQVRFAFDQGKGNLEPETKADDSGIASCRVYSVEGTGKEANTIVSSLAPGIGGSWQRQLESKKTVFTYYLPTVATLRMLVQIREENLGKPVSPSIIENTLSEVLAGAGYLVVDPASFHQRLGSTSIKGVPDAVLKEKASGLADILVIGQAESKYSSALMSGFHFARSRGAVRAIRLKTGKVIVNLDREGKEGGATPEKAGSKALQGLAQSLSEEFLKSLQAQLESMGITLPKKGGVEGGSQ